MDSSGEVHQIYEDYAQEAYNPVEEDPRDDWERKQMKKLLRLQERMRSKRKY